MTEHKKRKSETTVNPIKETPKKTKASTEEPAKKVHLSGKEKDGSALVQIPPKDVSQNVEVGIFIDIIFSCII